MSNNVTPDYLRGFILPLDVTTENIWQSQTSITQQNPTAGDPQPQQSSQMRILSSGNQSQTGDLSIVTRKAGSAGFGSRFTFKNNVTSTTVEYGRDAYNSISGFKFQTIGTLSNTYKRINAFVTSSDSLLISYQHLDSGINYLKVLKIDKSGTETTSTIYTLFSTLTTTQELQSAICELDDGSIILVQLLENDGFTNIRVHKSEDDGSTWSTVAREAFSEVLPVGTATGAGTDTYKIMKLQLAAVSGSVVLLIETEYNNTSATKRNQLFQYVSIDGAATFTKISTDTNLASNSFHAVNLKTRLGRYVISYVSSTGLMQYMELPNPFSNIHLLRESSAYVNLLSIPDAASGTNDYMTDGDTSMLVDDAGGVYVYAYTGGSNDFIVAQYSADGEVFKYSNGTETVQQGSCFNPDDSFTNLKNLVAVHWLGRGLLISNCASTDTVDASILITYLGGYSNLNLPKTSYDAVEADWTRSGFIRNYIPIDLPSDLTGLSVIGSSSDSLSNGYLRIVNNPSNALNRQYSWNNLPTTLVNAEYVSKGIFVKSSCIAVSGGNTSTNIRGFTLEMDDASNRYKVAIYITETAVTLQDINGSSSIASISHDNTQGIEILIGMANNKVSAWYRTMGYGGLRDYTEIASNQTITALTTSAAGHTIQFGHLAYASGTLETDWNEFHVSTLSATGLQLATGFENPDDLATREFPPLGEFAYVHDGVSICATDGSSYEGEEFQIIPQYDYPINNIFYQNAPTPRIAWRSAAVSSGNVPAQEIAIKLNPDTATSIVEALPNDLIGFHFNGVNWRTGDLYYHDGANWVSLTSITNHIRSSCVVTGRSVRGAVGLTEPYFTLNELAGWTAYFHVGADQVYRKVVSNTEGIFGGTSTTQKQATIQFLTNPPQGTGTVYFIPPVFSVVVSTNGIKAAAFKISIDAQETYDNDIRIGEIIIGPVVLPGRQYGRGRTISIESGTVTTETQDGIRYSREIKPATRVFNVAWTDGIDISQLQGSDPTVDYWMASNQSGAEPIAVNNDAPDLMMGFLKYVQGSKKHFVYLPNIEISTSGAGDKRYLNRQTEQALVTLESDVTIENVVGEELSSTVGEVFRIATITMKEIK